MKNLKLIALFFLLIQLMSCDNTPSSQGLEKLSQELAGLKKQVKDLEATVADHQMKNRIAFSIINTNQIFNTPVEDFFLTSDDFFDNPVDVGESNCIKGCARNQSIINKLKCFSTCYKRFPIDLVIEE